MSTFSMGLYAGISFGLGFWLLRNWYNYGWFVRGPMAFGFLCTLLLTGSEVAKMVIDVEISEELLEEVEVICLDVCEQKLSGEVDCEEMCICVHNKFVDGPDKASEAAFQHMLEEHAESCYEELR